MNAAKAQRDSWGDEMISAAINANGSVAWRETYSPFGEALTKPAANDNRRGAE